MSDASTMTVVESLDALSAWVGREVACSHWLTIDQARIQRFADATGDQQWIHTDPQRAALESPYKATIAHGYLTVSMLSQLVESSLHIDGVGMALNYGLDRVRLPAPVLAGQRIRARISLEQLEAVPGGLQAHWTATVDIEHGSKPACVAQMLVRYYPITTTG